MRKNRVKELRLSKGMTVDEVAQQAGLSQGYVTRIENGKRGLSIKVAEKLAGAFGVEVQDVLGIGGVVKVNASGGLAEDAVLYHPGPSDIVAAMLRKKEHLFPYQVKSDVLNSIDIKIGDILIVNCGIDAVENVEAMQAVLANVYDPAELTKGATVLRQYIPPALLITNSRTENAKPLNMETDEVSIKGVVEGTYRPMRTT